MVRVLSEPRRNLSKAQRVFLLFLRAKQGLEKLEKWMLLVGVSLILVLMLLTTGDVVGRYFFNQPIAGTLELTEYLLVAIVFLAVAYVQSQRGHIRVELATQNLPRKAVLALNVFGDTVGLSMLGIIFWQSSLLAWRAWEIGEFAAGVVHFPMVPIRSLFSFGIGVLSVCLLFDLISDLALLLGMSASRDTSEKKTQEKNDT